MPQPVRPALKAVAAFALAPALALGACTTVGPDFKAPPAPGGAAGRSYAMAGDPAPPAAPALLPEARIGGPWWQALGSPELDAVVRQGLRDSPTLAEATATLERAQAQAAAARGEAGPKVEGTAGFQRERVNIQTFGFSGFPSPTISLFSVGGTVSYDLDLFGGRRRAVERAQANVDAEARRADAAYLTLSGNIALQAIRIAALRAQIATVEQVAAQDQQLLDLVRRAARAGAEAPASTANPEAQLAEDQALLPPLRRELDAARHQLALLVGKSPAEWSAPDFDLDSFRAPSTVPVSLPSELVRRRPDILAAEADLHAATAAIGVATADLYPNVKLSAGLTQQAIHPENLFNYAASGWNIGPSLTAPIFNGGALKAERRAAEADARASLARYQRTVLTAFVQVSDVMAALARDDESIAALARATDAADRNARSAQTAYRLGGGTLMDVTDAQRTLTRARRAQVQARGQRLADLAQLFTATAADWRTPG
jgi:NodT family efflux transporter outer membrane factor (OMF) lipoprotein